MESVTQFEQILFPPFTDLLQRDVQGKLILRSRYVSSYLSV